MKINKKRITRKVHNNKFESSDKDEVDSQDQKAVDELYLDVEKFAESDQSDFDQEVEALEKEDKESKQSEDASSCSEDSDEKVDEMRMEEPAIVEVTQQRLQQIMHNMETSKTGGLRSITKIFSSVFNEKSAQKEMSKYVISDPKVMNDIFLLFFSRVGESMMKLPETEPSKLLKLIYLKNTIAYLCKTNDESVKAKCMNFMKKFCSLFLLFPTLNKKLIKSVIGPSLPVCRGPSPRQRQLRRTSVGTTCSS